ncbi:MAG: hypothetical protein ACERKZ_16515 [Lachnotalea sp.]
MAKEMNKVKKHGAHFRIGIATCVLLVLAVIAYTIGAAYYGYYSDMNPVILIFATISVVLCMSVAFLMDKKGDSVILRLMSLVVTILPTFCLMMLATARVYSIAVLMLSDLERDNVMGYYALYFSIGAMGLFLIAAVCNAISNFIKPYDSESKEILN